MHLYRIAYIIVDVRREVVKMDDFKRDLILTLIGVAFGKALDEVVEAVKRKASRPQGKHSKKP